MLCLLISAVRFCDNKRSLQVLMLRPRLLAVAVLVSACAARPPLAKPAPPSLHLSPRETYTAYLAARPHQLKMTHQVESRFADRTLVINGYLALRLPQSFVVQAQSAGLGPALFTVKQLPRAPLDVQVYVDALADRRFVEYLAEDIRRIYLLDCPAEAAADAEAQGRTVVVSCKLTPRSNESDDSLVMVLGEGGELRQKLFRRGGRLTTVVHYNNHVRHDGHWLAERIVLEHRQLPYTLTIALLSAAFDFDSNALFGAPVAQ